jgi:hypothetical protein
MSGWNIGLTDLSKVAIINHLIAVFVFGDSNLGKRSKNLLV